MLLSNHQPRLEDKGQQTNDVRLLTVHSPVTAHVTYCVGDIIDHNGSLGSSVVHGCQAVIPFLSSSVPDFKLNCCIIQTYCLCEEGSWKGSRKKLFNI